MTNEICHYEWPKFISRKRPLETHCSVHFSEVLKWNESLLKFRNAQDLVTKSQVCNEYFLLHFWSLNWILNTSLKNHSYANIWRKHQSSATRKCAVTLKKSSPLLKLLFCFNHFWLPVQILLRFVSSNTSHPDKKSKAILISNLYAQLKTIL